MAGRRKKSLPTCRWIGYAEGQVTLQGRRLGIVVALVSTGVMMATGAVPAEPRDVPGSRGSEVSHAALSTPAPELRWAVRANSATGLVGRIRGGTATRPTPRRVAISVVHQPRADGFLQMTPLPPGCSYAGLGLECHGLYKSGSGVSSGHVITNVGSSDAHIGQTFIDYDSEMVVGEVVDVVPPGGSKSYYLGVLSFIPDGYTGYASIVSDQPITGTVSANYTPTPTPTPTRTYTPTPTPTPHRVFLPVILESYTPPEELYYDDGTRESGVVSDAYAVAAVKFHVSSPRQLVALKYHVRAVGEMKPVQLLVFDGSCNILYSAQATPTSEWFQCDVSQSNITVSGEFYVGFQWLPDSAANVVNVGRDTSSTPQSRSYLGTLTDGECSQMKLIDDSNYMIRALVR